MNEPGMSKAKREEYCLGPSASSYMEVLSTAYSHAEGVPGSQSVVSIRPLDCSTLEQPHRDPGRDHCTEIRNSEL